MVHDLTEKTIMGMRKLPFTDYLDGLKGTLILEFRKKEPCPFFKLLLLKIIISLQYQVL